MPRGEKPLVAARHFLAAQSLREVCGPEAKRLQARELLGVRGEGDRREADLIEVGRERARGRDLGVELAQRSGGRVARIDKDGLAPLFLRRVETGEVGFVEQDLAARLEAFRASPAFYRLADAVRLVFVAADSVGETATTLRVFNADADAK